MNIYYYLFIRIFKRHNLKYGKNESVFFASVVLSCIIYLNLYTLVLFLNNLNVLPFLRFDSIYITVSGGIILLLINLLLFYNKKRFYKIESRYKKVPNKKNRVGTIIILLYIVISFVLFFVVIK
jgi:hypothetical protein